MQASHTSKIAQERSSVDITTVYSHKRYFINNLDSYHGVYFLKELSQVLERNNVENQTKDTSETLLAEDDFRAPPAPEIPYEIIGTVTDPKIKNLDNVARIVDKNDCVSTLLTCGTVILDLSCDRDELRIAMEYFKVLKELLEKETDPDGGGDADDKTETIDLKKRQLILISTVMTWANTKPLDPETPEMPFVETDFRKRKPHPNYKMHFDAENEVVLMARKYKPLIRSIVVTSGVTYGGKEDVLKYWFQKAWECEKLLPIFGRGYNAVPIINVLDLAKIVYNLAVDFPRKLYILAVEQNVVKQKEIIKAIGKHIGTGMFKCIPPEDAFLIPEIDQRTYDLMTMDLNMEPTFIVETMNLEWTSELPFSENVPVLYKQYKKETGLRYFKVVLYGPPIIGKSPLAQKICENYGLVYISPETVVQDIINDLKWSIQHREIGEVSELPALGEDEVPPDDEEDAEDDTLETDKQTLMLLESGRPITDDEILGYVRQRMLSRDALNRGWILDGYPPTIMQCEILFGKGEEQDEQDEEAEDANEPFDEDADLYSSVLKKLLPDLVVSLEATDDFICQKAIQLPYDDPNLDEESILKRLSDFRAGDTQDNTPLNFFDELDIHPLVVHVKDHTDYDMHTPYEEVTLRMGRPCKYGKLIAMKEAADAKRAKEAALREIEEEKARIELEKKLQLEREERMEYWTELYAMMREEEEAALAAASEPMRNYLLHHIFPTLTPALLEVAKLRPADPIDYLAEHLFKRNPTGKMFEPGFNLQEERLLGRIKILDEALLDLDIKVEPLVSDYFGPSTSEVDKLDKKKRDDFMSMSAL